MEYQSSLQPHLPGNCPAIIAHCCFLQENIVPNPLAKEELNFLARLLGGLDIQKPAGGETGFRLNLFMTDEEEEYAGVLLGLGLGCSVGSPGDQSWPLTALGSDQHVVLLLQMSPVMQPCSKCHWLASVWRDRNIPSALLAGCFYLLLISATEIFLLFYT